MDHYPWLFSLSSFLFLLFAFKFFCSKSKLPPSPIPLPVIGHLHLLPANQPLHRFFHSLSLKYGPIFFLRFGYRPVVIVSSPPAVEECFTKHDICLANRPAITVAKYLGYNHINISGAPYGDHWRNLRRITSLQILSSHRLDGYLGVRRDEIKAMLRSIYNQASGDGRSGGVELKSRFSELTFNTIVQTVTGKKYGSEKAKQLRDTIEEVMKIAEASYPGDYLPFVKWIDYGGFVKKVKLVSERTDKLLQELVDEQRNEPESHGDTMISYLLHLQESQPQYYSDELIKGLMLDMIFAGTDTTAVTLEWAMSNLLNHPQVLRKAQNELDTQIGKHHLIDEPDFPNKLPYLQSIILETLRLYPPAPLLLPHLSHSDFSIGRYHVPRNTMVLVNAWAIQRDPQLWDDAHEFRPERFGEGGDMAGHKYKLMPFGQGRRACPGMGLANRLLGFALGSLIQSFEWERLSDEEIDMTEGNGLTMPKAVPLVAMCKPRDIIRPLFE